MPITRLSEFWSVLQEKLPRDEWIHLQSIYKLIEDTVEFKADDFLPSSPTSVEPRWMRNVRNVLQRRKGIGDIAWDKNGRYMIPTEALSISDDGINLPTRPLTEYRISEEAFRRIRESREAIGQAGEEWVLNYEKNQLLDKGKHDLAQRIRRVSETDIAAGYDILSFEADSSEKYIEVKTTALSRKEFFISAHELKMAERLDGDFWIYLVTEIYGIPDLTTIRDPVQAVGKTLMLTPVSYQVRLLA